MMKIVIVHILLNLNGHGSVKTSMKNNAEIEFIIKKLRKDAAICP